MDKNIIPSLLLMVSIGCDSNQKENSPPSQQDTSPVEDTDISDDSDTGNTDIDTPLETLDILNQNQSLMRNSSMRFRKVPLNIFGTSLTQTAEPFAKATPIGGIYLQQVEQVWDLWLSLSGQSEDLFLVKRLLNEHYK